MAHRQQHGYGRDNDNDNDWRQDDHQMRESPRSHPQQQSAFHPGSDRQMGDWEDRRRGDRSGSNRDRYSDDVGNWGEASSVYGEDQMSRDFRAARGGGYGAWGREAEESRSGHDGGGLRGGAPRSYGYALEAGGYGGPRHDWGGSAGDRFGSRHGQGRGPGGRAQEERHPDPDYDQWRREQMKALDDDYDAFRRERYQKFSDEFSRWRASRQAGSEEGMTASGSSRAKASPGKDESK